LIDDRRNSCGKTAGERDTESVHSAGKSRFDCAGIADRAAEDPDPAERAVSRTRLLTPALG
jgi:hypothetical protein